MNQEAFTDQTTAPELPKCVRRIELGSERVLYLVGTAHVSKKSVEDVRTTIEALKPEAVCVELDEGRYRNLVDTADGNGVLNSFSKRCRC